MELSLLKAVLDEVVPGVTPGTFSERKLLQKAIYLAQLTGADLGYRFGWYVKGPYSASLADGYYRLDRNDSPEPLLLLSDSSKAKLSPIRTLLLVPDGVELDDSQWAELLASVHYLRKVSKLESDEASSLLKDKKPELAQYEERAQASLVRAGLL